MVYEDVNAVYAVNKYLNRALAVNLGWTPITYTNNLGESVKALPIIPSQQQPEFLDAGRTFLVYGSVVQPQSRMWAMTAETVVYTIWSPSTTEANKVCNFIHDLFMNVDESADAVNSYLDTEMDATQRNRYVAFTMIAPGLVEKAEPVESETGWAAGSVTVETLYTNKNQRPQTRFTYL